VGETRFDTKMVRDVKAEALVRSGKLVNEEYRTGSS
jgi:hypothetical protein